MVETPPETNPDEVEDEAPMCWCARRLEIGTTVAGRDAHPTPGRSPHPRTAGPLCPSSPFFGADRRFTSARPVSGLLTRPTPSAFICDICGSLFLRRLKAGARLLLACAAAILCAGPISAQLTLTPEDELQGGLEQYDRAVEIQSTQPDEARRLFLSAARRWSRIAGGGIADERIASGPLEFNIGNAFLQAGDTGRAILHYRRAERFIPGDAYLKNNLEIARNRRLSPIKATRQSSILRSVFFIHYAVARPTRERAALIAFALIWVFLLMRLFTLHRPALVGAVLSVIVAGSLGASVGVESWSHRRTPQGVVVEMDVVAFQGPGTGYKRKFVEPLQPGLEFTRLQRRGDWQEIELPDAQTGWIRIDQAALIAG